MLHISVMTKYAEPWHTSEIPECLFSFSVYLMVTLYISRLQCQICTMI